MNTHTQDILESEVFLAQYDLAFREHTMSLYPFSGKCTFCHEVIANHPKTQLVLYSVLLVACPYCGKKFIGD
mgnify:CR=1 FL=1